MSKHSLEMSRYPRIQRSLTLDNWTNSSLREPVIGNGVKWNSGFIPHDQPSPDAVEDWLCDQGREVRNECLESDGAVLHEPNCVASDINVLGSWVAGAFSHQCH